MGTPTNHTSSAFFGILEPDATESSLEEQSSIDCSNFYETSGHSRPYPTITTTTATPPPPPTPATAASTSTTTFSTAAATAAATANRERAYSAATLDSLPEDRSVAAQSESSCSLYGTRIESATTTPSQHLRCTEPTMHTSNVPPASQRELMIVDDAPSTSYHTMGASSTIPPTPPETTDEDDKPLHSSWSLSMLASYNPRLLDNHNRPHHSHNQPLTRLEEDHLSANAANRIARRHDQVAAWAIHVALMLFCGLVVISVVLSFLVIQRYGLVALLGLFVVVGFNIFLAYFVDQTILRENTQLRPIRRKILKVVQEAHRAVVEEFQLFQRDWNGHFLLTNGEEGQMDEPEGGGATVSDDEEVEGRAGPSSSKPSKASSSSKKGSVIFKMIKPFLSVRKKIFRRNKNKGKKSSSASNKNKNYEPPIRESEVV